MENLRGLSTFICVARTGNFSRAARELGITPQAASKHIQQLERWVGVRLFTRTTRKMSLTEEGASFYRVCSTAVEAIDDGVKNLHEAAEEAFGTVRIAVPHGLSSRFVAPAISRFLALHPRVSVDLVVQNQVPDLVAQRIDLGIIGDPLPESSMIARKFGMVKLVLCAAPSYLKRHGTPRTAEDLRKHRCINLRSWITGKIIPWTFEKDGNVITEEVDARLTTNDGENGLQAVLNGAGIAQLSSYRIAPHIRANKLKALSIGYVSAAYGLYIYMPRRERIPRKTRVLADFLFDELNGHADLQPLKFN